MQSFTTHTGIVCPLDRSDVDTDQLMPKQFLKRVERSGFGKFLFYDWRYNADGSENPAFVLNRSEFRAATILLARRNFGCGSSREHAPWGIADYGFRVVIASSFADIFYNNCFQNGILPIVVSEQEIDTLFARATQLSGTTQSPLTLTVDLTQCRISGDVNGNVDGDGIEINFSIDPQRQKALLEGLDDIGQTLAIADEIEDYESFYGLR